MKSPLEQLGQWLEQRLGNASGGPGSGSPGGHEDLRALLAQLEQRGQLAQINETVNPHLEITAASLLSLQRGGPALLFNQVRDSRLRVLGNLFASPQRVADALGLADVAAMRSLGEALTFFKSPSIPKSFGAGLRALPRLAELANLLPREVPAGPLDECVMRDQEVDLGQLPITTCWPEDAGPLITFGLVVTRGPEQPRANLAIYRQQLIGRNRLIMRWLAHRGGATDYRAWCQRYPDQPFPIAVAIGADPATMVAAVAPIPDTLSEYQFAGLIRGQRPEVTACLSHDLQVPARSEIVLEGFIHPGDTAEEGPFCDHTGYYNAVDQFPVMTVTAVRHRSDAIYHTSYMGRPPDDEPSQLASALNEMFVPLIQDQFPEICDFYLPPAACSYRVALISIRKQYPGHARRIMMGVWSWLRQFTYCKFVVVTDDDVDVRNQAELLWAISTRSDPARDTLILDNTAIDYLDFASPVSGLGGKMGLDATNKWPAETHRRWGRVASITPAARERAEGLWRDWVERPVSK